MRTDQRIPVLCLSVSHSFASCSSPSYVLRDSPWSQCYITITVNIFLFFRGRGLQASDDEPHPQGLLKAVRGLCNIYRKLIHCIFVYVTFVRESPRISGLRHFKSNLNARKNKTAVDEELLVLTV